MELYQAIAIAGFASGFTLILSYIIEALVRRYKKS